MKAVFICPPAAVLTISWFLVCSCLNDKVYPNYPPTRVDTDLDLIEPDFSGLRLRFKRNIDAVTTILSCDELFNQSKLNFAQILF